MGKDCANITNLLSYYYLVNCTKTFFPFEKNLNLKHQIAEY